MKPPVPSPREPGTEPAGIRWGPFCLRVPFVHARVEWQELAQGICVAGATALGLVPKLEVDFGLSFQEAVAFIFVTTILISSAPIVFGEPYASGWITPALPLALAYVVTPLFPTPTERFQVMTAVSIDLALLLVVLGITGLGRRLIEHIPKALKAAIILGAAIAAFKRVMVDDADDFLSQQPVTTTVAVGVCLLLTFSKLVESHKQRHRWLATVAGLGLLPGFAAAAVLGVLPGIREITFDFKEGILLALPFGGMWEKVSPFAIGWPGWRMFVEGMPLALIAYVILFGDLITGTEILTAAKSHRPDERVPIDFTRSHLSLGVRNALMALFSPFFPTQGCLWTGVQVIIVNRWKEGRQAMQSMFSGITSYYVFGIPVLFLVQPVLDVTRPFMGIALSVTLMLTGFACAYIAMALARSQAERGVALLGGMAVAICSPWLGITVAVAATLLLTGWQKPGEDGEATS